jgi:transcriptional regulator with XRE-family HTH domain
MSDSPKIPDNRKTGDPTLGGWLRYYRRQDGRSLKETAHACGISVSALSAYEKGVVMPSVPVLAKLCRYYKVRADELIRHLAA